MSSEKRLKKWTKFNNKTSLATNIFIILTIFVIFMQDTKNNCGFLASWGNFSFPDKFDNLFIGLGGFHTEIILACCGLYGPSVTDNTILKGTNHILCREAMRNLT